MNAYEAIVARRTVREFSDRPVADEVLERILDAGLRAPSNDHLRSWDFVVVRDPAARVRVLDKIAKEYTKEGISAWLDSWGSKDRIQRDLYLKAVPLQHRMLLTAPCLVLPFFRQPCPLLEPKSLSDLNAFASIWCCVENILVAAAAEGIFGVMRIPFDAEIPHVKDSVGAPTDREFPCYLGLGYPAKDAEVYVQHRAAVRDRIHVDRWLS